MGVFTRVDRTLGRSKNKQRKTDADHKTTDDGRGGNEQDDCEPPPGPPPPPALIPVTLPLVLPEHTYNLGDQGWTTVTLSQQDELLQAWQQLFLASKQFFEQPQSYKQQFSTALDSEEGWVSIEGEKEFITIRKLDSTPEQLREPASKAWVAAGQLLDSMLARLAESLDLAPDVLTRFSKPCLELDQLRRSTMLRLFRYENSEPKIVAEPHNDLGLLSLVMGDTPGLEVWSRYSQSFIPIEKTYTKPTASVLTGRQLQRFTNNRYMPGGHRVCAYPEHELSQPGFDRLDSRYRFSIVFVLRAHWPVLVDTETMTSRITGIHSQPIKDETAHKIFRLIQSTHYNVNTGFVRRAEQKEKIAALTREKEDHDAGMKSEATSPSIGGLG